MAKMNPEVAQKLRSAVSTLESILDDLPGTARAAVGLLKSMTSKAGKVKEDFSPDEITQMIEQFEIVQNAMEEEEATFTDSLPTISDTLSALSNVIRDYMPEASQSTCVCPKCGQEVPGKPDECSTKECSECKVAMKAKTPEGYKEPESLAASKAPVRSAELRTTAFLTEAVAGADGRAWEAILIEAGMSANRRFYPAEVLRKAYPLFEGVKAYVDHKIADGQPIVNRSVRDIAGWFENVSCDNGAITARFTVNEGQEWLRTMLKTAYENGKEDLVGFSILAEGKTRLDREDSGAYWLVETIEKVHSVDLVSEPAAGGRLAGLCESELKEVKQLKDIAEYTKEELKAVRPDLFEAEDKLSPEVVSKIKSAISSLDAVKDEVPAVASMVGTLSKYVEDGNDITEEEANILVEAQLPDKVVNKIKAALRTLNTVKKDLPKNLANMLDRLANSVYGSAKKDDTKEKEDPEKMKESVDPQLLHEMKERLDLADCRVILTESLASAQLPEPVATKIRNRFNGKVFKAEDLDAVIAEEKETLGKLVEMPDSPFIAKTREMRSESDKVVNGLVGMLIGEAVNDVPPFRSIKEAYSMATGVPILDVSVERLLGEARGYSSEGRDIFTESIQTSSWAEILGDSITRAMMREYKIPALDEWRKVCSEIGSIKDFRTQERIQMGGYGLLPAVGQGAPYQALTSPGDDKLTWAISKRGGLEDLTMETIINDDLGAVKRIPKSLARAAKITLYRFVFDLITNIAWSAGTGINAGVTNDASDALSDAALSTLKQKMRDQTAYGEATAFLQLKPKLLLVPNELEATALKLQTGEYALRAVSLPGGSEYVAHTSEMNIHRNTFETLVIDYWTSAGYYYLLADPSLANTVEVGFLNGKQEPELLTQDQQNVGSVFTADKITYKIRHIYGGVVLDYRSFFRGGS